MLRKSQLEDT